MAGSAEVAEIGSELADRYGRWKVIFIALASGAIPLFILANLGNSAWLFLFILLAGLGNGSACSAVVVTRSG